MIYGNMVKIIVGAKLYFRVPIEGEDSLRGRTTAGLSRPKSK